jgi:hypothetical protein
MKLRNILLATVLAGAAIAAPAPAASAFGSSAPGEADYYSPEDAAAFSKAIEKELAARGARVAMVFRSGRTRDALPDGVRYTHGSFWVYQPIETPEGRINGYVSHNLFHGDGDELTKRESYLATDFPFQFVSASVVDDVAIIIPTPEMQRRILTFMASPDYAAMNKGTYSLIANPHDPQYQNCNEFMLDVVAASAWETNDYLQIKSNLREHYEPTEIDAGPLAKIFGPLADERLRMNDHRGDIETVTFQSMGNFMVEYGLADEAYVFQRPPEARLPGQG